MNRKSIISLIIIVTMVAGIFGYQYVTKDKGSFAYAISYRDGIAITPVTVDATGVEVNSSFEVTFEEGKEMTKEDMISKLTLSPEIPFEIKAIEAGYEVVLGKPMEEGSLYTFALGSTTWVFQTQSAFKILGSLPRDQSTGVPLDSGIEIYMSHKIEKIDNFFTIEPKVSGKFEYYGNTVVFLPKELDPETVYTITLAPGLVLDGSEKTMTEGFSFSFETGMEDSGLYKEPKGYFNYRKVLNDFSTSEPLYVPMNYSIYDQKSDLTISAEVYEYKTMDDFSQAFEDYGTWPTWTNFNQTPDESLTKGLNKVMAFDQTIEDSLGYETNIRIPEVLEPGFYLLKTTWEDQEFQTFLQVSDLSYYYFSDQKDNYIWMHDLSSGEPARGATVTPFNRTEAGKADDNGMTVFEERSKEAMSLYLLRFNGMETLGYSYNGYGSETSDFWNYFQTDRQLYLPTDTISYFGFLQDRSNDSAPKEVRIELTQQSWYYRGFWPGSEESIPLVKDTVTIDGGFFQGAIELPNLDQGGYVLNVISGEQIISSHYITVENYVKPDYKLEITSDKKAIFLDEMVTFKTKASFFEGTPVSNVMIRYNLNGLTYEENQVASDENGEITVTYKPSYLAGYQGETYGSLSTTVTMPESGEIYAQSDFRIFINDINVKIDTSLEETKGVIKAQVNAITLDRINNGTEEAYDDYLDQPIEGKVLNGVIMRNEWVKTEVGETYDFIQKIVRKKYDYNMVTTQYQNVELITNADGYAEAEVVLPKEENVHYTVDVMTVDSNNRSMTMSQYFGGMNFYGYEDSNRLFIQANQEGYQLGDEMSLQILQKELPVDGKDFMMIYGRQGLQELSYSKQPLFNTTFDENFMPNVELTGVVFTGSTYRTTEFLNAPFDFEEERLTIETKLDQDAYRPGDVVTLDIKATYKSDDGTDAPVTDALVNLSLVDEALFALNNQTVTTLETLYGWVTSSINGRYGSHDNSAYPSGPLFYGGGDYAVSGVATESLKFSESAAEAPMADMATSTPGTIVRSEFKDTALFLTVKLDGEGKGTVTFKLPDNVTSWRLTTAAISESLKAGSAASELKVTLPFFINTNVNRTYLVGDQPYIGLSGYGSELNQDDQIMYTVICKALDYEVTGTGKAFEKVSLPLWQLKAGSYDVEVLAETESGLKDGYMEKIEVVETYQTRSISDFYEARNDLRIKTSDSGLTTLTFADQSIGQYIPVLYNLYYTEGKRSDSNTMSQMAGNVLKDAFGIELDGNDFSLAEYMMDDGGISLLPYSASDLATTVKIIPWLANDLQKARVTAYLYELMMKKDVTNRSLVLLGLALLEEPILLELNTYAMTENLTFEDAIHMATAYGVLGDTFMAGQIYNERIKASLESFDTMSRVTYSKELEDQYRHTAMLLPLASILNLPESDGLLAYVTSKYSLTYSANSDIYYYINEKMKTAVSSEPKLSYEYDGESYDVDFVNRWGSSITIPSQKMNDFVVKDVQSNVAIIATYNGLGLESSAMDASINVTRHYENYDTKESGWNFKEGDIVKVVIDWEIDESAIDDSYSVTDYAPSGLVPIKNPWNNGIEGDTYWYRDIDGQSVTFGVYKKTKDDITKYAPLTYYARVVSPGTFTGDPTFIQGMQVKDSFNIGEKHTLIIDPK